MPNGLKVDPKFILSKNEPLAGLFDGCRHYENTDMDNYHEDGRSRLVYGTQSGECDSIEDFKQYQCLKHLLMSGINTIDTGFTFRRHRSERIVGAAIMTLVKKYGMKREDFFVISK